MDEDIDVDEFLDNLENEERKFKDRARTIKDKHFEEENLTPADEDFLEHYNELDELIEKARDENEECQRIDRNTVRDIENAIKKLKALEEML